MKKEKIVLGIDPGTAITGFGIIRAKDKSFECLKYGVIKTYPSESQENRLEEINKEILKLIEEYQPDILSIEKIFFFKNAKTVIPVSQARGVILRAAYEKNLPIFEYTPLQAKMATVGYGRAEKKQVQEMVKILLNLKETPKPDDAADALALAICYLSSETN